MWMETAPDGDLTPIKVPVAARRRRRASRVVATLVVGFFPGLVSDLADGATFASSLGR